jgi:Concanavalin A-like lectin/glucanases superfamily/Calx-beta domain/CARDB
MYHRISLKHIRGAHLAAAMTILCVVALAQSSKASLNNSQSETGSQRKRAESVNGTRRISSSADESRLSRWRPLVSSVSDLGNFVAEFNAQPAAAAPNLTPYQPTGWTDKIVVSPFSSGLDSTVDTRPILITDNLYVSWAAINSGTAATGARFYTKLFVDGVEKNNWYSDPPLDINYFIYIQNYSIGHLSAGTHTIRILADATGTIAESNESDNEYTKTITVVTSGQPNLAPYQPPGWSDKVVVSNVSGTTTDRTPLFSTDDLYVDWAVTNNGNRATEVTFYTKLYVDGIQKSAWYSAPPVDINSYQYVSDFAIGKLLPGEHFIELVTNTDGSINESDYLDNEYVKTFTVNEPTCFSLANPGIVGWWGGGDGAHDASGNNHDATIHGTVAFAPGMVGEAFGLDGATGYLTVPDAPDLYPTDSFTVEAWIKTTKTTGTQDILSHSECSNGCPFNAANSAYELSVANGRLVGFIRDTTGVGQTLSGTTLVATGSFHHVALQRDSINHLMRLYVDGAIEASATLMATGLLKDSDGEADPVVIGGGILAGGSPSNLFSGILDEVVYFDRALTAAQVQGIYKATSAGMCGGATNDNFARARGISGISGQIIDSNVGATKETNELNHAGVPGGASVWYRWQSPFTGPAVFSTFGSDFDTLLAVYTGASINGLTLVTANDDSANTDNLGRPLTSNLTLNAVIGTTYYIAVDGSKGRTGNIVLGWGPQASITGKGIDVGGTVLLSGDDSRAVPVDAGKTFTFDHLRVGGNYEVKITGDARYSFPCIYVSGDPHFYIPLAGSVTNNDFDYNKYGDCSGASEVTGYVTNSAKVGIGGVAVTAHGPATRTETTDGGYYSIGNLPAGAYTVTPASGQYTFSPTSQPVNLTASDAIGADFTAKEGYLISGVVRLNNGAPITGVTVKVSGSLSNTTMSNSDGYYSVYAAAGETSTVTASKQNVVFTPSTLPPFTNLSANQKNADFVAATLTISGHLRNVNGRGLSGETVNLSSVDGTVPQQTGTDGGFSFTVASGGTYDVAPSDSRVGTWSPLNSIHHANLTQSVSTDDFEARFPSFTVSGVIKNGSGATLSGVTVQLIGTIILSSGQKQVNASYPTNSSGSYTSDQLNVLGDYTFSPATPSTVGGTTYGSFNPTNRAFPSILPCFSVSGATCDPNSSTSNYLGADFTAIAAPTPVVTVGVSPLSVNEDGAANLVYTFSRTDATSALTVNFSVGGTATFNNDYTQSGATTFTSTTGTIAFAAGETTKTVTVDPTSDTTVEPNETVVLTLTAGTGYNVGASAVATGTIINDDTDVSVAVSPSSVTEDGATNLVYTFSRAGATNASTVNFSVGGTATFNSDYTQSGATTFTATTGTIAFAAGEASKTVTVDPTSDTTVEPNETVILTVTPGTGYNVASPSSATGTITNDDTDVTVAVSPSAVNEDGATNLVYTFTRNGITNVSLVVNFSVGGTATFNSDYTQSGATTFAATTGTIAFAAGETSKTVTVDPTSDTTVEPNETVILTVTSGTGYNVASPSSATGTITNDDTDVSVAVSPASVNEDGPANLVYTFTRNGVATGAITVNFSVGGTATLNNDYTQSGATTFTSTVGTIAFASGETSKTVTVDPTSDTTVEPDETVVLTVTSGTGYSVGSPGSATGIITNDDATQAVQFSSSAYSVTEGTPHVDVTVTRTGDMSGAASVSFSTSDSASSQSCSVKNGFASSRCDYEARFATLKFAAGESSKTVSILINDDAYLEGPETFSVNLANPSGATLGAISTATVTINDNELTNGPNPIDGVNFFVTMQYLDFLNREPDPPGLAFWIGNINNCTPQPSCTDSARVSTSAAFYVSIEFQQTGYLVERLYKTSYGDAMGTSTLTPPGPHSLSVPIVRLNEFLLDTQQIAQGVVVGQGDWQTQLENNKQAFMLDFVQRTRFTNAYPTSLTPAQFVDALNQSAGLVLSANERTTAINLFGGAGNTSNQMARALALRQVAEDPDLNSAEFSRAFVLMQYFGYLRRNPNDPQDTDYSGYEFWLNKMNAFNGDYLKAEMVKAFITTPEYRQRFGP